MKNNRKDKTIVCKLIKVLFFAIVVMSLFGIINSRSAYADEGGGWAGVVTGSPIGSDPYSGDPGYQGVSDGFSWIYYETEEEYDEDISFGSVYTTVYLKGYPTATISGACSRLGGFWHYGGNYSANRTNRRRGHFGDTMNLNRYFTLPGYYGHWITMPYGYYSYSEKKISESELLHDIYSNGGKDEIYLIPTGKKLYSAKMSAKTNDSVVMPSGKEYTMLEMFNISYNYMHGISPVTTKTYNSMPKGAYAFCFNESMVSDYLGVSNGWVTDESGANIIVDEVTTGIVDKDSETIVDSKTAKIDDTVNLNFKHGVYSKEANKEAWWRVSEIWFNAEKSTGKFEDVIIAEDVVANNQAKISNVKFGNNKEGDYYIPDGNPVSNPVVEAVLPIKIEKGGTYVFCQDLRIAESEEKMADAKVTSEVCISVKVTAKYYGMSMAYVESRSGGSSTTSTEIVPMDSKVTASPDAKINVQYGDGLSNKTQYLTLTFAHDIYSDSPSGEVYWGIRRDNSIPINDKAYFPDDVLHFTSEQEYGYYVNETTSISLCSVNPDADICRQYFSYLYSCTQGELPAYECEYSINGLAEQINAISGTYNGKYVIRDTVGVSISSVGTYKYCERLYIADESGGAASAPFTSQACIVVEVSDSGPPSDSAETYVKSRIKNTRLSDDEPFGGFRGVANRFEEIEGEDGNIVYAKPGDVINWQDEYSPGAQRLSGTPVLTLNGKVVGTHGIESCGGGSAHTYKAMGEAGEWDNAVSVEADYPLFETPDFGEWNRGEYHLKREAPIRSYLIRNTADESDQDRNGNKIIDVGKTYTDMIQTVGNTPQTASYSSWGESFDAECKHTCGGTNNPHTCWIMEGPFYHSNYIIDGLYTSAVATPGLEQLKSNTFLKIPFNFENTLGFEISRSNSEREPVYPGETVQVIDPFVTVNPRVNSLVAEDAYATEVRDAKVVLIAYVSDRDRGDSGSWDKESTDDNLCAFVADWVVYDASLFCREVNRNTTTTLEVKNDNAVEQQTKNGVTYKNHILGTDFSGTYNVFDAKAGDWFCMTLGVYPATSGANTNLDSSGSKSWRLYTPKCIQIAKKPSFQVWGSGVYSAATGVSVTTNVSEKNNLFKVRSHSYNPRGGSVTVFGSWVEENVTTIGSTQWLVSGASLGKNNSLDVKGGYDGIASIGAEFCKRLIPLSFANYGFNGFQSWICPGVQASGYAGVEATAFEPSKVNAGALAEYWENKEQSAVEYPEAVNLGDVEIGEPVLSATSKDIRNIKAEGDITIGESKLERNQTRIVKADNVTIVGNINYDNEWHVSLNDLSKVVIYASSNINIACGVSRVDAVLLAAGTVNTCSDAGGIDDANRSNQLVVNGTIITNAMKLERTYGNAMGISDGGYVTQWDAEEGTGVPGDYYETHTVPGSETPAEIINYDTSLIIWGASMAGAGESNTLTVTYQHELAPRY